MNLSDYPFLQNEFYNNTIENYLISLAIFLALIIGLKLFQLFIVARIKKFAKKTKNNFDDILIEGINAVHWPFYVIVSLNVSAQFIVLADIITKILFFILLVAVSYYSINIVQQFIDYGVELITAKKKKEGQDVGIIRLLGSVAKISLWAGAILLIISNLGFNIMSLVAGLGIGGIAIALAMQSVLEDLFSSVSIYFDKPFKIGDFIYVGDKGGTVKKVGVKTTRIEMLQGEELVVSNTELTKTQVRNYGKMKRRRVVINLGVTYDTSSEKLKKIPDIIKNIISKYKLMEVDRINFTTFGDSALIYELVIYVNNDSYADYLKDQHLINIEIKEKFEKEKIEFAYPTQTLFLKKQS